MRKCDFASRREIVSYSKAQGIEAEIPQGFQAERL
jgi:hypothetical protein